MKKKNLSNSIQTFDTRVTADIKVGIVRSQWNEEITGAMYQAAIAKLKEAGVLTANIYSLSVPGTFELTSGARIIASQHKVDSIICLGCVIKGETSHDVYINQAVATGLTNLGLAIRKPVIFGVLTTNDYKQAKERAGGKLGNKGVEAAVTAITMAIAEKGGAIGKTQIGFT